MTKLTLILFVLIASFGFSQNATFKSNSDYRKAMKAKAKKDIQLLQNGVLLVRIHGRSQEINYYKKYNNVKAAQKVDEQTKTFNKELIKAFRQGFNFCPVYFFEDTFSMQVRNGEFDKIIFYSDSLTQDPMIKVTTSNYYIAELGFTEGDTTGFRSDYFIESDEDGTGKETRLYKEENLNISAFVIRDKNFVMLREPFPYYSKIFGKNPSFVRMRKKLYLWNSELNAFLGFNS